MEEDFEAVNRRASRIRIAIAVGALVAVAVVLIVVVRSGDSRTVLQRELEANRLPEDQVPALRAKIGEIRADLDRVAAGLQIFAKPIDAKLGGHCTEVPKELPEDGLVIGEPLVPEELAKTRGYLLEVEGRIAAKVATKTDADPLYRAPRGLAVFVVGTGNKPTITRSAVDGPIGRGQFRPGSAKGTAYLYSYDQQRILCAGPVDVENSDEVSVGPTESADRLLLRELTTRVLAALARDGRAVI
jgi:hypothetical protein